VHSSRLGAVSAVKLQAQARLLPRGVSIRRRQPIEWVARGVGARRAGTGEVFRQGRGGGGGGGGEGGGEGGGGAGEFARRKRRERSRGP
jgi:hypothetical protein